MSTKHSWQYSFVIGALFYICKLMTSHTYKMTITWWKLFPVQGQLEAWKKSILIQFYDNSLYNDITVKLNMNICTCKCGYRRLQNKVVIKSICTLNLLNCGLFRTYRKEKYPYLYWGDGLIVSVFDLTWHVTVEIVSLVYDWQLYLTYVLAFHFHFFIHFRLLLPGGWAKF